MFEKAVSDALAKHLASDDFKTHIEESVGKAVVGAIDNAVGWQSDFRDQLNEQVNAIMPDVKSEDWTKFEAAFRSAARQQLATLADQRAEETLNRLIGELVPDGDRTIELDELKHQLARFVYEENEDLYSDVDHVEFGDDESQCYDSDYVLFEIKHSTSKTCPNYFDIKIGYLNRSYTGADTEKIIELGFSFKDGGNHEAKMWRSSGIEFGDLFSGPYFGFKATLFRLYTGQLRLVGVENPTAPKIGGAS